MAEIKRKGQAVWEGELRTGSGKLGTESGALTDAAYAFDTRFEDAAGTNPEELIAAAHAACYAMALAHTLEAEGHTPGRVATEAVCTLSPTDGGFEIAAMDLQVRAEVDGLDDEAFRAVAQKAEKACPVSNALRGNLQISLDAALM